MKYWLMLQDYTALNTMYRKTPQKQTTFISPNGNEKQIDYILTKRRYLIYNKDAEANDMIHMGSGHRCVMATFTVTTPGKDDHCFDFKGKHDMIKHERSDQTEKILKLKSLSSKKDTKKSSKKKKNKPPPKKKAQRKQKVKMQKHKQKMRTQQQQKQNVKMLKRKQKMKQVEDIVDAQYFAQ